MFALKFCEKIEDFNRITKDVENGIKGFFSYGLSDSQKSFIIAGLKERFGKRNFLVVVPDALEAKRIAEDLEFFLGKEQVLYFPSNYVIPYETEAKSLEFTAQRLSVLEKLLFDNSKVVVAPLNALVNKLVPPNIVKNFTFELEYGREENLEEVILRLIKMGYERVEVIEGRGQFAQRGGILDIFPLTAEYPYRIEFFGDEIDSIRRFNIEDQRSFDRLEKIRIFPAREVIFDEETGKKAALKVSRDLEEKRSALYSAGKKEIFEILKEKVGLHIDKLERGIFFESAELYTGYLYEELCSLMDYFSTPPFVFFIEPGRLMESSKNISFEIEETYKGLLEKGHILPSASEIYFSVERVIDEMKKYPSFYISMFPRIPKEFNVGGVYSFQFRAVTAFNGKFELLVEEIMNYKKRRYGVIVLSGNEERGKHLSKALREKNIEAVFYKSLNGELMSGQVVVIPGSLGKGFEIPEIRVAVISDTDVYGRPKVKQAKPDITKKGKKITAVDELSPGDYVVHATHGIGRYLGVETLEVEGNKRDYFALQYLGGDKLYVPTDQVELIYKYVSPEDKPPKLNKLGGSEWSKTKAKVKESIKEMAKELIELYAARQSIKGFAFSKDTVWQQEFEEMFPYEETPDQLMAIEEVKRDMESDKCMDRIICGDVGYGKTEVALRAAFKAVMDGKQVAVLVPTTILAEQHYRTFSERFSPFPLRVEVISRFKSKAEQKAILKDLKNGAVDVIIGTHRLLQKDVKFKDLGLLIIDEEQRFGVAHKEKIKQLKKNVDVLTMTATPIPRTLHMALSGIRDMSLIETPPENRFPVQTYVVEYNDSLIRDAILRELSRDGQVYYVYNRVQDIREEAMRLSLLVPEARIAVAHGQMDEDELEEVMLKFYHREYDVLVCTTIIETGLDIPNVNTLIVINSDRFGLSQLYQLRGRVGRSNRQAFAYFTYKKDKVLSEQAEKRLAAIREFTEFGAGFKLAMRDLEIRGAGNVLGTEQHGHMMAVGYDLYCKLLEEAVRELKGEIIRGEEVQPVIDLKVNAFISEDYIQNESLRMEIYRRIAALETLKEAEELEEEIEDRFGDLPQPVRNLLSISKLKLLAKKLKIANIIRNEDYVVFKFKSKDALNVEDYLKLVAFFKNRIIFSGTTVPSFSIRVKNIDDHKLFIRIEELLKEMADFLFIPYNE
ncbi:transcription-repair coupling factor [Thermovenabulum sp.]|uniref:transcription-repair coupling factor n=1 Tax=Thermovenabulum sp. TaxID=3100335 RepID=UPI003C7B73C6